MKKIIILLAALIKIQTLVCSQKDSEFVVFLKGLQEQSKKEQELQRLTPQKRTETELEKLKQQQAEIQQKFNEVTTEIKENAAGKKVPEQRKLHQELLGITWQIEYLKNSPTCSSITSQEASRLTPPGSTPNCSFSQQGVSLQRNTFFYAKRPSF